MGQLLKTYKPRKHAYEQNVQMVLCGLPVLSREVSMPYAEPSRSVRL